MRLDNTTAARRCQSCIRARAHRHPPATRAMDAGGPGSADEHLVQRFTTATQRLATSADVLAEALQLLRLTRPSFQRTVAPDAGDDTTKVCRTRMVSCCVC